MQPLVTRGFLHMDSERAKIYHFSLPNFGTLLFGVPHFLFWYERYSMPSQPHSVNAISTRLFSALHCPQVEKFALSITTLWCDVRHYSDFAPPPQSLSLSLPSLLCSTCLPRIVQRTKVDYLYWSWTLLLVEVSGEKDETESPNAVVYLFDVSN